MTNKTVVLGVTGSIAAYRAADLCSAFRKEEIDCRVVMSHCARQFVGELTVVNLSGSGSDPDADSLTYSWSQIDGPSVSITNSTMAAASFMAPDVIAGSPETLTFQLTVSDGSLDSTDTIDVVVSQSQFLAGQLFYELPQPNADCRGLNFSNVLQKPARRMTVLLLDASNNVLDTSTTGDDGSYRFSSVPPNTDVRVRIRAELVQSGAQSWQVYVRDNTSHTNGVPRINERPIYEVQWALINTGSSSISGADFVARTGWDLGAGAYTGTRAAAPLAIADMILDGVHLVAGADANVDMGRIDAYWSINNSWALDPNTDQRDYDSGRIGTTHYTSFPDDGPRSPGLFLLGDAVGRFLETEEITEAAFDAMVVAMPNISSANWDEANKPDIDQSELGTLTMAGIKYFVDEIRVARLMKNTGRKLGTLNDVAPREVVIVARRR